MQFEDNRVYRVKAVAEKLDISPATIYRAIESGQLNAYKLGTGKGTLRVQGAAVNAYLATCGSATVMSTEDTQSVADVSALDGAA